MKVYPALILIFSQLLCLSAQLFCYDRAGEALSVMKDVMQCCSKIKGKYAVSSFGPKGVLSPSCLVDGLGMKVWADFWQCCSGLPGAGPKNLANIKALSEDSASPSEVIIDEGNSTTAVIPPSQSATSEIASKRTLASGSTSNSHFINISYLSYMVVVVSLACL